MGWREDILHVVERLPSTFRVEDVYRSVPDLYAKHPGTRQLRERIRAALEELRREGRLHQLGTPGTFARDPDAPAARPRDLLLTPGQTTNRGVLADLIGLRTPDPLRRGMFPSRQGPLEGHMFLFHDERDNPYGDLDEGDRIYYVGQGQKGDQTLTGHNRTLAEHLDQGVTVHYFVQPRERPGELLYRGEVIVEKTERVYRPEEERSVLVFTLVPERASGGEAPEATAVYGQALAEIFEYDQRPQLLPVPRRDTLARRAVRDAAFRRVVLDAYGWECAVCGEALRTEQATELQAAHIVGVGERGPDDPRNGISFCSRHHWAFDAGVFTLTDACRILWLAKGEDPHGEIVPNEPLQPPRYDWQAPDPYYLRHHRAKWRAAAA